MAREPRVRKGFELISPAVPPDEKDAAISRGAALELALQIAVEGELPDVTVARATAFETYINGPK